MVAAAAASLSGVEWVRQWFYQIAWWGYLLTADGLLRAIAGSSPLMDRPGAFLRLLFWSAVFWYGFEALNFRLDNWHYLGAHPVLSARWAGGFIAFATVLPAVLLTHRLLEAMGVLKSLKVRPIPPGNWWHGPFFAIGLVMLALPLAWPRLFFPLAWGFWFFLLEPVNHAAGLPSIMGQWEKGQMAVFFRLGLAGLLVGLLWEAFNTLGGARWDYTIPYLATPKLFAMPLAGFGGYPPFAVECWVFAASLGLLHGRGAWPRSHGDGPARGPAPLWVSWPALAMAVAFMVWAAWMMDRFSIRSFA